MKWPRCELHGDNPPIATHEISWGKGWYQICKWCYPSYTVSRGEIRPLKVRIPKEVLQRLKNSAMNGNK